MAKFLTEEEVAKMENQAKLAERKRAAELALDPERARRDQWHQDLNEARGRRLQPMMEIARLDRGRYSPITAQAAQRELERVESNRRFDKEMEVRENESDSHMLGLIGQGRDAAKERAEAEKAAAAERTRQEEIRWKGEQAVKEIGKSTDLGVATIQTEGQKDIAKTQTEGQKDIAKTQTEGQKDIAKTQTEGQKETEVMKQQTAMIMQRIQNDAELEKARITSGANVSKEKMKQIASIINGKLKNGYDADLKNVIEIVKEQFKDDPEAIKAIDAIGAPKSTSGLDGDKL